jgi:hypothetical protein
MQVSTGRTLYSSAPHALATSELRPSAPITIRAASEISALPFARPRMPVTRPADEVNPVTANPSLTSAPASAAAN